MPLIEPGRKAPNFELRDQDGKRHALKDYAGRPVVLYFYPKDDTSHCTDQACQFRDHIPDFRKIKALVLGVSPDDAKSHRAFAEKHDLDFTLLCDDEHDRGGNPKVSQAYGAWGEKSMYGRRYMGVVRTTYLIDADGKVRRRWDRVNVKGHVAEVLGTLKEMLGAHRHAAGATPKVRKGRADSNPPFAPVRGPRALRSRGPAPKAPRVKRARAVGGAPKKSGRR